MAYLIAVLGAGKGTWGHVSKLIRQGNFEKVILVTNQFGKEKFTPDKNTELLVANFDQPILALREELKQKLQPMLQNLMDTDIALNFVSGNGPEHMALLSAVIGLGLGIRLVIVEQGKNEMTEL